MAYDGEPISFCTEFDFSRAFVVVVSGVQWNPCGHMLLNTGGIGGWYFHINEVYGRPRYMREDGYRRYLRENDKTEISRTHVVVPNRQAASRKLEGLMNERWAWMVLPHNCVRFVEVILQAGGARAGLYSNCAIVERWH